MLNDSGLELGGVVTPISSLADEVGESVKAVSCDELVACLSTFRCARAIASARATSDVNDMTPKETRIPIPTTFKGKFRHQFTN